MSRQKESYDIMITIFLKYFKNIRFQKIILWCYLVWYLTIMSLYFEASLKLWASSVGISLIIGFALVLSTNQQGVKQNIWAKIRLFLFPFCVSSYSATIKDYDFILLFPSNLLHLLISILNCLLFLLLIWCIKTFYRHNIQLI
ncbi:putative neutral ceramidase superfamily lipid hydrolase [Wenyingzhuangia aestuarii]|nr:putative neutral ceramidase superfamily lipid hydrolase [Wenyingzhuangia aestuarii]